VRQDPHATIKEVASQIRVRKKEVNVSSKEIVFWQRELQKLNIPLVLETWVPVDETPCFDFWFDTRADSMRLSFFYSFPQRPPQKSKITPIAQWMQKVRFDVENR